MNITFYGAAGEVTGSCYLVEAAGKKILVDCGLFQGVRLADVRNHEKFPFDPHEIFAVLLTHSHADHSGKIPKLVHDGFSGHVWATAPTADLTELLWKDNLVVMQYDFKRTGHPILFQEQDVVNASRALVPVQYRERKEVFPGFFVTWLDAGHILGSSFLLVEADGKRVVFSGDQGNRDVPILEPTDALPDADMLLCEATYGATNHEAPETRTVKLIEAIRETVKNKGVLMIPSFAIERTQELLFDFFTIVENHQIPKVPVFLDSPLAIDALAVYKKYKNLLKMNAACIVKCGADFFQFPGLTLTRSTDDSKKINSVPAPKVIIAGAGMMNGGRILHHLVRYLPDPNSEVLVVGYQAAGTVGRHILDREPVVQIHGENVHVRARVRAIGAYSAHADQQKLLEWIAPKKNVLQKVIVVHADAPVGQIFAKKVKEMGVETVLPALGEKFLV